MHEFRHWVSSEEIRSSIGIQKFPPFAKPFKTSSSHPRPRHPQVRSRVGEVIPLGNFFHSHLHVPEKACTRRLIIYCIGVYSLSSFANQQATTVNFHIAFAIHQYDPGRQTSFLSTSARRVEITIRLREMDKLLVRPTTEGFVFPFEMPSGSTLPI